MFKSPKLQISQCLNIPTSNFPIFKSPKVEISQNPNLPLSNSPNAHKGI